MTSRSFLVKQLTETAKAIDWAISLMPENRLLEIHPAKDHPKSDDLMKNYFGSWSAYRLLFHLVFYEENYAIPGLKSFLDNSLFPKKDLSEDENWEKELLKGVDVNSLLKRFHIIRENQIEIINKIEDESWIKMRTDTYWGKASAEFSVSKTIQHSFEHGNKIMRLALYWDKLLNWLDQK
jgi:hypothetical protein